MRKCITPAEMKRVELRAMQQGGVTGEQMMQAAAAHVADAVRRRGTGSCAVCFCGTGNNGGDGLAAMRMLAHDGYQGTCCLLSGTLSPDAQRELEHLRREAPQIGIVSVLEADERMLFQADCVIDALFGTGLARPIQGEALAACERIRLCSERGIPVVAVDIPSGLNGKTGVVMGAAVKADCTVTFHRPKPGLYLNDGPDYAGAVVIAPIGLPTEWDDADGMAMLEKADLKRLLPARVRNTHKGSYGRVLLLVGSRGMAGAAAISALAALRTGAGLATVACPERIVDTVQTLCPCATCLPLPEDAEAAWALLEEKLEWADAVGVGCGLGTSEWAAELMLRMSRWQAKRCKPMVLDADALNLTARMQMEVRGVFVTPHPAETARLLNTATADVTGDPADTALRLAQIYGCAVLKGACSVMCDGETLALNPYGCAGMAKGGSGDALTGILTALLAGRAAGAYQMSDLETMQAACALHGLAGERAQRLYGERGMLATDLCDQLGLVDTEESDLPQGGAQAISPLGRRVTVTVEHALHSREEGSTGKRYPLNCGYVQEVLSQENEWQDAWIADVRKPVEWVEGIVSARLRLRGGKEVWVVTEGDARISSDILEQAKAFFGDFDWIEP